MGNKTWNMSPGAYAVLAVFATITFTSVAVELIADTVESVAEKLRTFFKQRCPS